jgi:hypothetical protein
LYDCSINVKINQKDWQRATKPYIILHKTAKIKILLQFLLDDGKDPEPSPDLGGPKT